MVTDIAKVRRIENELKLSIRGRIVGLRLQDMNSMVGTALTIERERSRMLGALGMRVLIARGRRVSVLLIQERSRGLLIHEGYRAATIRAKDRLRLPFQAGQMVCYHCQQLGHMRRDCPQRQGSQGFETAQSQSAVG